MAFLHSTIFLLAAFNPVTAQTPEGCKLEDLQRLLASVKLELEDPNCTNTNNACAVKCDSKQYESGSGFAFCNVYHWQLTGEINCSPPTTPATAPVTSTAPEDCVCKDKKNCGDNYPGWCEVGNTPKTCKDDTADPFYYARENACLGSRTWDEIKKVNDDDDLKGQLDVVEGFRLWNKLIWSQKKTTIEGNLKQVLNFKPAEIFDVKSDGFEITQFKTFENYVIENHNTLPTKLTTMSTALRNIVSKLKEFGNSNKEDSETLNHFKESFHLMAKNALFPSIRAAIHAGIFDNKAYSDAKDILGNLYDFTRP